jgi:hypothetical protein
MRAVREQRAFLNVLTHYGMPALQACLASPPAARPPPSPVANPGIVEVSVIKR